MTHERANRIAWIGWGLTLPLAYLGPVLRPLTGVRGSGRWPILAAVGVMLVVLLLIRRDRRALGLSLGMSASGLAIGATGGFVSAGLLSGQWLAAVLALKWVFAAAFLTWLLRRELHENEEELLEAAWIEADRDWRRRLGIGPDGDIAVSLAGLSDEDRVRIYQRLADDMEADMARSSANLKRLRRKMTLVLLATASLILLVGGLVILRR